MDHSPVRKGLSRLGNQVYYLSLLPDLILLAALIIGSYLRFQHYHYEDIIIVLSIGSIILAANLMLKYYFAVRFFSSFFHLWTGCLLGMVALYDISINLDHSSSSLEESCNILLMTSIVCQIFIEATKKCCRMSSTSHRLWRRDDFLEFLGGALACLVLGGSHKPTVPLLCLMGALFLLLSSLKVGSCLSLLNMAFFIWTTEAHLFPLLQLSINPYGVICFMARLSIPPFIDLLVGSHSKIEKWSSIILAHSCVHKLILINIVALQTVFFLFHWMSVQQHKEWYIVVPMFFVAATFWMVMHLTLFIIIGTLQTKFIRCQEHVTGIISLKKVLAARGLRYFSLVAQRLAYLVVVSTVVLGCLCWTIKNEYNHSIMVMVIAIELMIADLLSELSNSLGGTIIGYSIVAPNVAVRTDGLVTVLPPDFIQDVGNKSTKILQLIMDFFNQHVIINYGCDWSMNGIKYEELDKKLVDFFSQLTNEGPRYDTYFLFYSGPTSSNGDWALTGNATLSLDRILSLWESVNGYKSSRLILMCDSEQSHEWLKPVWRLPEASYFVALQTYKRQKVRGVGDLETPLLVGDFTSFYASYNGSTTNPDAAEAVWFRPHYAVSRAWTDFAFHLPNKADIADHWLLLMPRFMHRLLNPFLFCLSARVPLSSSCGKVVKRSRMRLWPPSEIDTGHGFKLLRL